MTSAIVSDDLELPSLDTRLMDKDHFNSEGRLSITAEEFVIPTSIYGELRSFSVAEHIEKRKAVGKLMSWYNRIKKKNSADAPMHNSFT